MSLIDALLLDPAPFDVWFANRNEVMGNGTLNDPYDGSTQANFDSKMSSLPPNTRVHLGPGTFETKGYSDEITPGWQIQPGMKIVGSGIDVTTLKIVNMQTGGNPARVVAIGHALTAGSPAHANLVDFAEVSDLTIDCNLGEQTGTQIACGAVRLMGNHVKVVRVKAQGWGTMTASKRCFAIAVVTGDRSVGLTEVVDAGIEGCIAVEPSASDDGPSTALHAGGKDETLSNAEAYGKGPYIRNCFVDCGSPTATPEYRGLSMGWCRGGIVEGNQVHNTKYGGPYQGSASSRDVIVRNNFYRNVAKGPFWELGILNPSTPAGLSGLARDTTYDPTGKTAIATKSSAHDLQVGERVKIDATGGPTQYRGVFVVASVPSTTQFRYKMVSDPGSQTVTGPTMQKVIGLSKVIVESNTIELMAATSGDIMAIQIKDVGTSSAAQPPDYPHGEVVIRNNKIRYEEGLFDPLYVGSGIDISGAKSLLVSGNVLECAPSNPIKDFRCGTATYSHNTTPAGALIQGLDGTTTIKHSELETEAEDALLLNLM